MSSTLDNSKMQEGSTKTSSDGRRQFKLTRRIGLGGFGEVYLAEMSTPTGFTKTVALKLLRSDVEGAGDNARRMRDEARLLGLLRHRAIVKADDLITVDGRTAVVMEFVPGANLSDLLNEERFPHPLPANLGLEVGAELADAMDAAWSRPSSVTKKPLEVLHRDIKPGNVRITPDGEIKILDFGIARADQMDRETATRDYAVGSLPYMAPELLVGQGASPASDMYALGVTLLEILTRSRFGIAQDTAEAHVARVEERLASIELPELDPCREELESLIRGMLAFEASGRPEARAVAKQLNQISHSLHLLPIQDWARQKIDQVQSAAVLGPNESVTREDMSGRVFFEDIASKADTWDGDTLGLTKSDVDRARERREDKSWIWKTALIGLIGLLAVLGYRLLDGDGAGESDAVVQASSEGTGTDGTGSEGTGTGSEGTGTGGTGSEGTGTGGTGSGGPGSDGPGLAVTGGPGAGGQQDESASLGGTGQAPADSNGGSEELSMDRSESGSSASDSTQSVQPSSDRGEPSQTPQSGSDSDTQPTEAPPEVPMGPVVVKVSSEPTMQIDIQLDGAALKTPHKQELVPGSYRLICNPQGAAFSATIVVPADGGSWTCNTTLRKVTGP